MAHQWKKFNGINWLSPRFRPLIERRNQNANANAYRKRKIQSHATTAMA